MPATRLGTKDRRKIALLFADIARAATYNATRAEQKKIGEIAISLVQFIDPKLQEIKDLVLRDVESASRPKEDRDGQET